MWLAPASKLGVEEWAANDVHLDIEQPVQVEHLYRSMDFLFAHEAAIQEKVFWAMDRGMTWPKASNGNFKPVAFLQFIDEQVQAAVPAPTIYDDPENKLCRIRVMTGLYDPLKWST